MVSVNRSMMVDVAMLLLRLSGLLLASLHGWSKLVELGTGRGDGFVAAVAGMGFPVPVLFAWAAALAECVGGLCVALGLGTRIAAPLAAATMFVAAFVRHRALEQFFIAVGLSNASPALVRGWGNPEKALIYFVALTAIALLGPGRFSLDHLMGRRR